MIISSSQHKLAKLYLRLCFGGRVAPIKCTARDNPAPVQRHVSALKPTSIVRLPCRAVQHTCNGISHRVPERLYCSPDEHRFGAGTCPRMPLICSIAMRNRSISHLAETDVLIHCRPDSNSGGCGVYTSYSQSVVCSPVYWASVLWPSIFCYNHLPSGQSLLLACRQSRLRYKYVGSM